jgi:hypothetical protein
LLQTQKELKQKGHAPSLQRSDDRKKGEKNDQKKQDKNESTTEHTPTNHSIDQPTTPIGDEPPGGCKHKRKKKGKEKN